VGFGKRVMPKKGRDADQYSDVMLTLSVTRGKCLEVEEEADAEKFYCTILEFSRHAPAGLHKQYVALISLASNQVHYIVKNALDENIHPHTGKDTELPAVTLILWLSLSLDKKSVNLNKINEMHGPLVGHF
jgi:hypothetical protein